MVFEQFAEAFAAELGKNMDPGVELERRIIKKVNEELSGISVRYPDSPVAPTIYLNDLYEKFREGYALGQLVAETVAKLKRAREDAPDVPDLSEEAARERLYCVVINADKNEELLKDVPHERLEDLAVIPRYRVRDDASFIVKNDICSSLHMTSEEVLEAAHANTNDQEFETKGMAEVLGDVMKSQGLSDDYADEVLGMTDGPNVLYVLTNQSKVDGAAALTSEQAMESAYERIKSEHPDMNDMYVLGSSRHELILIPDDAVDNEEFLRSMHMDIQSTELVESDRLTDNIYRYIVATKQLSIVEAPAEEKVPVVAVTATRAHARVH